MNLEYREYDTDIFYNTEDGSIIHMEPEIGGVIVEQERPSIETIAMANNLSPENVKVKSIKFGSLLDVLKNRQLLTVDEEQDKFIMSEDGGYYVIHYDAQYEKHDYSYEEVQEYYNEHYLFNLRNILFVEDLALEWVSIDQMELREETLEFSWFNYFDDGYIVDSFSDRGILAQDIMENGTYWPLLLRRVEDVYVVYEGNHRIISAKLLQMTDEWDNREMLAITTSEDIRVMQSGIDSFKMLPKRMRARAPYIAKFYDLGYPNDENKELIEQIMRDRNMIFVDDRQEIVEYDIYTYMELLQSTQVFPHWLRDMFYSQKEAGHEIKGHKIINSKESFEEWMVGCLETL